MAVCEHFRVSSLSELRHRGVLAVNCAGRPLLLFYNGGRPCAIEHSLDSIDQSHAVCPSTYLRAALAPAHVPPFALEIRGEEIWVSVDRPRYKVVLASLRRYLSRLKVAFKIISRDLQEQRIDPIAPLRRSSRRVSPEIVEGE